MRLKLISTIILLASIFSLQAQLTMPSSVDGGVQNIEKTAVQAAPAAAQTVTGTVAGTKPTIGSLLSQFSGQISPSALTDAFNKGKSAFQTQAKSATTAKTSSALLQKLEAGLKSTAFTAGWAKVKDKWLSNTKAATTIKQVAGSLKTLSENVDPKVLGPTWVKIQPTFSTALNVLAQ